MSATTTAPALSLADLEAFDPQAPPAGQDGERRFLCPLAACADKPADDAHRCLSLNVATGLWTCYRCDAGGKLRDHWTERPLERRSRSRAAAARAFALPPERPAAEPASIKWRRRIPGLVPVEGTPALDYLTGRGFPLEPLVSLLAEVRVAYAPAWDHWAEQDGAWRCVGTDRRVVFPLRDPAGELVGLASRAIDGDYIAPEKQSVGAKKAGVFATPGALRADPLVIVEAPIDALALAVCGVPALALVGTSGPTWLPQVAALRCVLIGLDNDVPGDAAAAKLARDLGALGARCERLRPGGKDWAEDLAAGGHAALTARLAALVGSATVAPVAPAWDACAARSLIADLYARVQATWPTLAPAAQHAAKAVLDAQEPKLRRAFVARDLPQFRALLTTVEDALVPCWPRDSKGIETTEVEGEIEPTTIDAVGSAWLSCPHCQNAVDADGACRGCRGRWCQLCAEQWLVSLHMVECEGCRIERLRCQDQERMLLP
jgi:hypothetical protein